MKTSKFILFCVLLGVFECVGAKRISELKCSKLATLNTDPKSLNPHLMELVRIDTGVAYCKATLISEYFVLTVTSCAYDSNMRIRKFKLPGEQLSDSTTLFTVKRILDDQLADERGGKHVLALIELNEAVPYRNTNSIYRPACLWTNTLQPSNLYAWSRFNKIKIDSSLTSVSSHRCSLSGIAGSEYFADIILQSHLCITPPDELGPLYGSPIEVKDRDENFIFGLISYGDNREASTYLAAKINSFIEWIEPKVWPIQQSTNVDCGQRILKHKPLLSFAQPTYYGEYPWHVALYRDNTYHCGGTILNTKTILTAAHCLFEQRVDLPTNRFKIVAGAYNLTQPPIEAQNFFVQNIVVHENYDRTYLENDIALLKLSGTIIFSEFIQPICISNTLDLNNFTFGSVAGWGRNEFNQPSNVLLQAKLPIHDNSVCRKSNRDFFPQYLNDNNFCAGYDNGTNICSGDSGSSMIIEYDSRWFIRGLVSLGVALPNSDRCDITELVIFTDVPKMFAWIMVHMEDN